MTHVRCVNFLLNHSGISASRSVTDRGPGLLAMRLRRRASCAPCVFIVSEEKTQSRTDSIFGANFWNGPGLPSKRWVSRPNRIGRPAEILERARVPKYRPGWKVSWPGRGSYISASERGHAHVGVRAHMRFLGGGRGAGVGAGPRCFVNASTQKKHTHEKSVKNFTCHAARVTYDCTHRNHERSLNPCSPQLSLCC